MFQNLKPWVCWPVKEMIVKILTGCFKPTLSSSVLECLFNGSYTARAQSYSPLSFLWPLVQQEQ